MALEGAHRFAPGGCQRGIPYVTDSDALLIGAKWLRLKFPRFCFHTSLCSAKPLSKATLAPYDTFAIFRPQSKCEGGFWPPYDSYYHAAVHHSPVTPLMA